MDSGNDPEEVIISQYILEDAEVAQLDLLPKI
jgi:hypothetical protein